METMKEDDITQDGGNGYVRTSEFDELKEMFATVLFELRRFGDEQRRMAKDITSMKGDITSMKGDITSIRSEIGGLSRSVSYALENEAYRELPRFLKDKYGIEIAERFIRTEVKKDCEINILGKGTRHGKPVLIVGEAKLRLQGATQQMAKVFDQLERNAEAVRLKYKDFDIVGILITHFATANFLEEASKRDVIVVQSFEW
ncbi:hypothetical protein MBAV_001576 [Candidatus Magnetobacterium bavaricum]|uniref:DUF8196 domain-containing protein n=1 Tax=Candidatus Magnetobacterium bavaricum TaxID=29290 RepID=A0A0F3GW63_9BACT|nr:hypothetical protein MBAV_001576 [Candidatus Magnetobacterium bavaricum]